MGESLINLSWASLEPAFQQAGFPVSGVVDVDRARQDYLRHAKKYESWISRGLHGSMKYLERGLERRLNPELVFPHLKSVITVLMPYSSQPVQVDGLRYARYLNGQDYHDSLKEKLDQLLQSLLQKGDLPATFEYKICVDTSAVLERTWAALSGLGWIGKNTLLIHPQLGSYVFIGVVFTNAVFNEGPRLLKDYCGSCTRCLGACPTEALQSHELNSNRCISYLTLEKRGPWEEKLPLKNFIAGCDLCQEACPYNTKAVRYGKPQELESYLNRTSEDLVKETEEAYLKRTQETALSRIRYADFKRNLEAVLSQRETHK